MSYSSFQAAEGNLAKGVIAAADVVAASASVTGNWANPGALTWDGFVRRMSQAPFGYPLAVIHGLAQLAWPFLPARIREGLSRREQPAAPSPSLPSQTAPQTPTSDPAFARVRHLLPPAPKPVVSPVVYVAAGIGGVGIVSAIVYFFTRRKRG